MNVPPFINIGFLLSSTPKLSVKVIHQYLLTEVGSHGVKGIYTSPSRTLVNRLQKGPQNTPNLCGTSPFTKLLPFRDTSVLTTRTTNNNLQERTLVQVRRTYESSLVWV